MGFSDRMHSKKQAFLSPARLVCLLVASAVPLLAQQFNIPTIQVTVNRLVATDPEQRPLVEPQLAIDPNNPQHWLAGVIAASPDKGADCAAFVSFNGGLTWERHDLGLKECYDPWVGILPDGKGLMSVIGNESANLLVYRSDDGGRTWDNPVALGSSHDGDSFIVEETGSKNATNVFVVSTQTTKENASGKMRDSVFVARSVDGGRTFQEPIRVFPSNLYINALNPAFLSDGTLLVPYGDYARNAIDGGGTIWLDRERDWLLRSHDGGRTFFIPALMSESCSKSHPMLAVDESRSPFHDRVYWLCNDGLHQNIYLHYSPDGGEHWSNPIRVNRNSGTAPDVRNAVMAVSGNGTLGITWYDARADKRMNWEFLRCQELYFTASIDGGATFLPEVKVGARSCPLSDKNGKAGIRWVAGGDYDGMATTPDDTFHLLWSDSRDGVYKLWTASVTVNEKPRPAEQATKSR